MASIDTYWPCEGQGHIRPLFEKNSFQNWMNRREINCYFFPPCFFINENRSVWDSDLVPQDKGKQIGNHQRHQHAGAECFWEDDGLERNSYPRTLGPSEHHQVNANTLHINLHIIIFLSMNWVPLSSLFRMTLLIYLQESSIWIPLSYHVTTICSTSYWFVQFVCIT